MNPTAVFNKAVNFFLPRWLQADTTHPRYHELRVIVSSALVAEPLMLLFPIIVHYFGKPVIGFVLNDALVLVLLLSIKFWGHFRVPMSITAFITYFIIYSWIKDSGMIYSVNNNIMHMYLLIAIWVDKRYGWWAIFGNLIVFSYIYYQSIHTGVDLNHYAHLGGPTYPFLMNCLITIFFGGFLAYQQYDQELDRAKVRALQDRKITVLDDTVKVRTEQLNSMRETIATDFHDQTGNMLPAITRQASLLQLKLQGDQELQLIADSIISNSNELYASSKDFLWHLHNESDDPAALFNYLTSYGQLYYNQFDIAFSSSAEDCRLMKFSASAALNLIFIFKEAMTNVVKHSGATEVKLTMLCSPDRVTYLIEDNGSWKVAADDHQHYGLENIRRRCEKNNFEFSLSRSVSGTLIAIIVSVT